MALSNLSAWNTEKAGSPPGPFTSNPVFRFHRASEVFIMKQYFAFQWHITDACDQRCKHCYIFSEDNGKKPDEMRWAQMEDTLRNCLDFCETYGRLPYFYITGGDPILHPAFWRLDAENERGAQ